MQHGRVRNVVLSQNPLTKGYRLTFDFQPKEDVAEIRASFEKRQVESNGGVDIPMVELKFYQPEELIKQFLQSWHIQDAQTVAHMQQLARPHFASLPDLYSFLKKYVLKPSANICAKFVIAS